MNLLNKPSVPFRHGAGVPEARLANVRPVPKDTTLDAQNRLYLHGARLAERGAKGPWKGGSHRAFQFWSHKAKRREWKNQRVFSVLQEQKCGFSKGPKIHTCQKTVDAKVWFGKRRPTT